MRAARVCLLFVLLCLASLVSGGGGGRRGKGKPSKRWHVADTEDQCGQTTQLNTFRDARPASICSDSQSSGAKKFCVCVTRDDPNTNPDALWKFKCGLCELRWKPSVNKADKLRKKNIQQQRKKARFERMRKTRRKLKKEQKRKQKKQNRKGLKYLHA